MTHDEVHALASEYVLGGLDQVTRARTASHLASCTPCADEVRHVAQTMDALGRSVPELAPAASLRDRIAGIPARVPQIAPVVRSAARPAPWFAAIAASLIAAVAMWQAIGARAEVQRLKQELAQMQVMTGRAQVARVSLEHQVEEFTKLAGVLRASDLVSYSLVGSGSAVNAHARAYVTHKNGMVFTADGLPILPAGKVYQLWVIVDAKPVSVGTFSPEADGSVKAVMPTPDIASMPGALAVTLEPTGGLAQPSTTPILVGTAIPQ
ncbi:MAG: anti-sigma factor [Vicinamibacterales bacterium]